MRDQRGTGGECVSVWGMTGAVSRASMSHSLRLAGMTGFTALRDTGPTTALDPVQVGSDMYCRFLSTPNQCHLVTADF